MLLYISSLGMMIFIFVAGLLVQGMDDAFDTRNFLKSQQPTFVDKNDFEDGTNLREISLLIMILCYIAFSSLGVMVLPWTLISELFPIEVNDNIIWQAHALGIDGNFIHLKKITHAKVGFHFLNNSSCPL